MASFPRERAAPAPLLMWPVVHPHSPVEVGCCRRIPVRAHQEAHFTFAYAGHVNCRVELDLRCNVLFDKGRVVRRVVQRVVVVLLGDHLHRFFEAFF